MSENKIKWYLTVITIDYINLKKKNRNFKFKLRGAKNPECPPPTSCAYGVHAKFVNSLSAYSSASQTVGRELIFWGPREVFFNYTDCKKQAHSSHTPNY
jgi:hypothetical protein